MRIAIAPGTLEAHANGTEGSIGVNVASSHGSHQVNRSYARAQVGVGYSPPTTGQLFITPSVDVTFDGHIHWDHAVARSFGNFSTTVFSYDAEGGSDPLVFHGYQELFDLEGRTQGFENVSVFGHPPRLDIPPVLSNPPSHI